MKKLNTKNKAGVLTIILSALLVATTFTSATLDTGEAANEKPIIDLSDESLINEPDNNIAEEIIEEELPKEEKENIVEEEIQEEIIETIDEEEKIKEPKEEKPDIEPPNESISVEQEQPFSEELVEEIILDMKEVEDDEINMDFNVDKLKIKDDPSATFGYPVEGTQNTHIENRIVGVWGEAVDGNGTADYIMAYIKALNCHGDYTGNATAGLYEYIDDNDNLAGILLSQTEIKTMTIPQGITTWVRFNFTDTKPTITNKTRYYCVLSVEEKDGCHAGDLRLMSTIESNYGLYRTSYYETLPDPFLGEISSQYRRCIYCSYTPFVDNHDPVAEDDNVKMNEDDNEKIFVLKNDHDEDGDALKIEKITKPKHGKATIGDPQHLSSYIEQESHIRYTPEKDYFGEDSFEYTISDYHGGTDTAMIYININPVNDNPVANDDKVSVNEDEKNILINVLDNDYDVDGDHLDIIKISDPLHGSATTDSNPALKSIPKTDHIYYTPDHNYFGYDEIVYMIDDGNGGVDKATVYINVLNVNDPPNIPSCPNPSDGDVNINLDVIVNWTGGDPDGDIVTYDIYFGTNNNLATKNVNNQSATTYNPGTLNYNTKYYWKVVAWDSSDVFSEGPIWEFTTGNAPANEGNSDGGSSTSSSKGPSNSPPVADTSAGAPYQGFVDSEIIFDGSLSFDIDGNIVTWSWNFGDGTRDDGEIVTHVYSKSGAYAVVLTVTDNKGATSTHNTIATISQPNRPPTGPEVHGPKDCVIGSECSFAALSEDFDNDYIKYLFDWGDGNFDETEFLSPDDSFAASFLHSWDSAGTYDITVTVSDNKSVSSSEMTVVITEPAIDYLSILILGSIIAIFILISLILVKTGAISIFGKK